MKKLIASCFAVLFAISLFSVSASAQPLSQVPTFNVTPDFTGQWTLGFPSGRMNDIGNGWQNFPYVEMPIVVYSAQQNEGGTVSYNGNVIGTSGSSVNIFYNPAVTPKYVEVYVYIPEPSIGSGNQYYLQISIRMFISPDGSYMSGTMTAAFYDNMRGVSVPTILYHSDVFMSRQGARG